MISTSIYVPKVTGFMAFVLFPSISPELLKKLHGFWRIAIV